jgi:hypothetical protein
MLLVTLLVALPLIFAKTDCVGIKRTGSFSSDVLISAEHAEAIGHFSIGGVGLACSGRACRKPDTKVKGIASKGSVKVRIPPEYPTLAGRVEYYYSQVSGGFTNEDYEVDPTLPELHFIRSTLILRNTGSDDVTVPLIQYESHDHYVKTVGTVPYPSALKGHNDEEVVSYTVYQAAAGSSCPTRPTVRAAVAGSEATEGAVCVANVPGSASHVRVEYEAVTIPASTTVRLALVHVMVEVGDALERVEEEKAYEQFLRANEFVDTAWFADLSASERRSMLNFACALKRPSVSRADAPQRARELDSHDEL